MKRILTLLIILISVADIYAQRDLTEHRPVWFGVNMGGTWQTSDMKPVGGIGWGFTVARYSRISNPSPIYWGWRFRFLDGRNFGYNYHALYGVKNNPVLSGYYSNTDPDTGFVYSNYKMRLDEFAGEIIIGSNTLRKHGVLLYGWGGVGMTYWKTNTDLLDVTGNLYNYSTITDNGDEDAIATQLEAMLDRDYETNANGSVSGGQWGFMPSAGIGFGYQWSNFSIAMEHKTTWALNDFIDGTSHNSAGAATEHLNDIYHYDGLSIKWNFHNPRNNENNTPPPPLPPTPDQTQYNQNPPQPIPVDPTPNPNPQPTPNIPGLQPPTVTFTTPSTDPYTANTTNQNLVVRVTNVAQSSQISLQINNQVSTNFSFNPATSTMTFSHTLNAGTNTYKVIATNSVGSAQDVQTIIYKQGDPTPAGNPPTVVITAPNLETYTSSTSTYLVSANVTNVDNAAGITVKQNGNSITNFSYNTRTKVVTYTATLSTGNNYIIITGTNQYGNASDACTIIYGNANTPPVNPPPVVTITNPNECPYQTKVQNHTLTAGIQNVTQKSQVTVVFNGQSITNFTFTAHGMNASVSFPVVLNSGVNNFTVTGTNSVGTDSKSCQITYKPSNAPQPPDVEITQPNVNPYASPTPAFTLKATVLNVASAAEITMTANSSVITGWSYDMNSKVLTYSTTLQGGSITYVITATNANGTDNDQQVVTYKYVPPVDPNNNVPVDPNQGGGQSRPGETTVSPGGNVGGGQQSGGGQSRPGETTVSPGGNVGGGQQSGGGQSRPGETTVSPNGNVGGDPNQSGGGGRPTGPAPTIDLHVPSMSPVSTGTTTFPVTMIVNGVNGLSDITVRINQVVMTSGISYNASTKQLSFTATLINGQNSIQVKAVNANGQATKTLIVNCNAAGNRQQQSNDPKPSNTPEPKKDEPKKEEPKKEDPKPAPAPKDTPKPEPKKEEPKPAPSVGGRPAQPAPAPAPQPQPAPRPR